MNILQACLLGVLQGVTEFLPVSSSGHLVLGKAVLGLETPGVLTEVVLHAGTAAAILVAFRKDVKALIIGFLSGLKGTVTSAAGEAWRQNPQFRLALLIIAATVPAGLAAFAFGDAIESLFRMPALTGAMLILTGAVLLSTKWAKRGEQTSAEIGLPKAIAIGAAQAAALLPGVSRSGSTISCGLFVGLDREFAARFSFLLGLPAMIGAAALKARKLAELESGDLAANLLGGVAAGIVGYFMLILLIRIVKRGAIHHFSWYCFLVGVATIVLNV